MITMEDNNIMRTSCTRQNCEDRTVEKRPGKPKKINISIDYIIIMRSYIKIKRLSEHLWIKKMINRNCRRSLNRYDEEIV